jgi:hypothetical protein
VAVDGVLTRGKTRWEMAPRGLTAVAPFLRDRATLGGASGAPPAPRGGHDASSRSPLAFSSFNCSEKATDECSRRALGFQCVWWFADEIEDRRHVYL